MSSCCQHLEYFKQLTHLSDLELVILNVRFCVYLRNLREKNCPQISRIFADEVTFKRNN